ncbi:hypothetical protein ALC53_07618 [Atta colombica]|uniref:Uncharacterized protein n=1 Tax=Atta colombica TaxID=520822 RepID=A0A151I2J7_9HYME|nr:hypothetical protein ALC53_07618 [Atta colombica]
MTEKTNQNEDKQATDEEKKDLPKSDSSTGRDKANTSISQTSSIFGSSTSHTLAKECPMGIRRSILPIICRGWTAIVANKDDHNRPDEHWVAFYIDEHGIGTYSDSYGLPPLNPRFLL